MVYKKESMRYRMASSSGGGKKSSSAVVRRKKQSQPSSSRRRRTDSITEASSDLSSRSSYSESSYDDETSVSSSSESESESESETSYQPRRRKHTVSKKGRDYRRKNEDRRAAGRHRQSRRRERSPETYESRSTRQTYSTVSKPRRREVTRQEKRRRGVTKQPTFDTAHNSKSKLKNVGLVVKASDLSDYSDHFTLDSREMDEFEDFVHKHQEKKRETRDIYESGSDDSSALYSLAQESEKAPSEPSEETSGIVEVTSGDIGNKGNCALREFFCMDDDASIQGSYGGLRNGEILIASSTLSTHHSMMVEESYIPPEMSTRSDARKLERMESSATTMEDHRQEVADGDLDGSDDDDDDDEPRPSGMSRFFCSWGAGPSDEDVKDDDEDDEDEDEDDHSTEETSTVDQEATVTTTTDQSRSVVWERPDDHASHADSVEPSLDDARLQAIAQKARSDNVLSQFKAGTARHEEPTAFLSDPMPEDNEGTQEAKELAPHVQVPVLIESPSLDDDASQGSVDLPYQRTLVLGDNVEVTGISEVEAGNGDTGFVIYLRVSRTTLTDEGQAAADRAAATRRSKLVEKPATIWQSLDDVSFEVLVAVSGDDEGLVTKAPRLLIENNASHYLENLCQLSEASYYCLDKSTKQYSMKVIQSRSDSSTSYDLQTTSTLSRDSFGNHHNAPPAQFDAAAQFMFCIKASDLMPIDKDQVEILEPERISSSSMVEDSRHGDENAIETRFSSILKAASSVPSSAQSQEEAASREVTANPSKDEAVKSQQPKYHRGMSRAVVKARMLLNAGKKPRNNPVAAAATAAAADTASSTQEQYVARPPSSMESTPTASAGSLSNRSSGSIRGYLDYLDGKDEQVGTAAAAKAENEESSTRTRSALLISKVEKAAQEARDILARMEYRENNSEEDAYNSDDAVPSSEQERDDDQLGYNRVDHSSCSPKIPTHVANVKPETIELLVTKVNSYSGIETKWTSDEKKLQSYEDRVRLAQQLLLGDSSARVGRRTTPTLRREESPLPLSREPTRPRPADQQRKTSSSGSSSDPASSSTSGSDEFYDTLSRMSSNLSVALSLD